MTDMANSVLSNYLQVVPLPGDVRRGLLAGREADEDALPVRRVGLLRLLDHRLYHDAPERNRKIMLRRKTRKNNSATKRTRGAMPLWTCGENNYELN